MRLRSHRRNLVLFSSSVPPTGRNGASRHLRSARVGRTRRLFRFGVLYTVIAVRPPWWQLLSGTALTVFGVIARDSVGGVLIVPGLFLLYGALLTAGDSHGDRERRSQLQRDLAAYSTPAQRRDLEATLDRYPDDATCEIRKILAGQAMASDETGIPGRTSKAAL